MKTSTHVIMLRQFHECARNLYFEYNVSCVAEAPAPRTPSLPQEFSEVPGHLGYSTLAAAGGVGSSMHSAQRHERQSAEE